MQTAANNLQPSYSIGLRSYSGANPRRINYSGCLTIRLKNRNLCRLPGFFLGRLICGNIPLITWSPGNHKVYWMIVCWMRLVNGSGPIEKVSVPEKRFVDFSRLTEVAVRTNHLFEFARKRAEQFAGVTAGEVGLV